MTHKPKKAPIHMNQSMQHITPLPKRVQPHQWEDLGSFLVRTAKAMGYETPQWLLQPETSSYRITSRKLTTLSLQADYDFLSQLLLVPETRLYQMTIHRFSPLLESSSVAEQRTSMQFRQQQHLSTPYPWRRVHRQLFYRDLGGFFLSNSSTIRICPLCAQAPEAYDRIYWRIRPLLTCPIHQVLLQTSCPRCLQQWPSLRFSGARCPSCLQPIHQDPKDIQTQNHPAFFFLLQGDSLLLQMFGYEQGPSDRIAVSRAQDLRAFLPADAGEPGSIGQPHHRR
ncbi:TniQ family protein [Dictyobacter halimunensis]|uniref:TniQ family protein n=1 Tax=Dictyobacter halimunensis TaxID=3026934 RepID=UPI003B9844B4